MPIGTGAIGNVQHHRHLAQTLPADVHRTQPHSGGGTPSPPQRA